MGADFLDVRKVRDTVGHYRVLAKLPLYGINPQELQWFLDGVKSETKSMSCGVRQGSILGPLLFIPLIKHIDL